MFAHDPKRVTVQGELKLYVPLTESWNARPEISDTMKTVAAISAFVLAITRHPKEREQAQAEIDAVIGRDRLPTPADRERLPYCHALYLEVIRCYTLGPLGK